MTLKPSIISFTILLLSINFSLAQRLDSEAVSCTVSPKWQASIAVGNQEKPDGAWEAPWFKGASLDETIPNLPYQAVWVPIQAGEEVILGEITSTEVNEQSEAYFKITSSISGILKGTWYPASPVVLGDVQTIAGQRFQLVKVYPLRIRPGQAGTQRAKSTAFTFSKRQVAPTSSTAAQKTYTNSSVLASGTWLKIGLTQNGIYRIDFDDLNRQGLNPDQIDPRSLRIHGNGGRMLPQEAGRFPHDDLRENPIWVSGEADGSFDSGDYLLFYGAAPHQWNYFEALGRWAHEYNVYADTTYYFLTFGQGQGMRLQSPADPGASTFSPDHAEQVQFYEKDVFNPLGSGRFWLGESYGLSPKPSIDFNLSRLKSGSEILVSARMAARSRVSSSFRFTEGANNLGEVNLGAVTFGGYGNRYTARSKTFNMSANQVSDGVLNLQIDYVQTEASSTGYLDYLEVQWDQNLDLANRSSWIFRNKAHTGVGEVFQYELAGGQNDYRIWDVTDPTAAREMNTSLQAGKLLFKAKADSAKTFFAFKNSGSQTPASLTRFNNQDLHGLAQAEFFIVTAAPFRSAANQLAKFHRDHLGQSVQVVDVDLIFNEFGSGQKDPTAMRDFIKMFYDRWQENGGIQPRYLMFMGDGGYDYKQLEFSGTTAFIPTYQARNSHNGMLTFSSDDYFGYLDDGEGFWGELLSSGPTEDALYWTTGDTARSYHSLDIAIGRLPVGNPEQAQAMVDKIISYKSSSEAMGPWRNKIVLVADHKDSEGSMHLRQVDLYTDDIQQENECINIDKVYMDNYQMEQTASTSTFPDGRNALLKSLNQGALVVNYVGHGGEVGWSNSQILTISDINKLENGSRLPAFITATCEFGRWDDPGRASGAEQLLLSNKGGAIAMFTTVRVVVSGSNNTLNNNFYKHVFDWNVAEQRWPTMGEVFMRTKNDSWIGGAVNNRKFSLLGDPAMALVYPENTVIITKINGRTVSPANIDSLASLSRVTIEGEVRDPNGTLLNDYQGLLHTTVFDKPSSFTTHRRPYTFSWQKNRVFNGQASISGGKFSFQFVVPLDVSYEDGRAKISMYVENGQVDGAGCHTDIYVGGSDSNSIADDTDPEILLYMNDEKFVDGGMTSPSPVLIAEIYDENGMNTLGSSIGHDLTAILDGDVGSLIVLNDYYAALKDNYQEGLIKYAFSDLETGEHHLEVKVWDVANNSTTSEINFLVADDAEMALGHVLNYPNPFTTQTKFYLEHNLNDRPLNVQIKIFTVSGKLVKTLQDSFFAEGNLYCDLDWDGLDEYGDAIGRGVYVYQVLVKDESTGEKINRFEKMVLLR